MDVAAPWTDQLQAWGTLIGGLVGLAGIVFGYVASRTEQRERRRREEAERREQQTKARNAELERRMRGAKLVSPGWGVVGEDLGSASYGVVVHNDSGVAMRDAKLTVRHLKNPRFELKRELGPIGRRITWSARDIYREARESGHDIPVPEDGDEEPQRWWKDVAAHAVEVTYADEQGIWLRDGRNGRLQELKPHLVIWAEAIRAEGLKGLLAGDDRRERDDPLDDRPETRIDTAFEPFPRTSVLQRAFDEFCADGTLSEATRAAVGASREIEPPDLVVAPHDWLGKVMRTDDVEPTVLTRAEEDSFHPRALAALSRYGRLYAIPYTFDTVALIRNRRLTGDAPMPQTLNAVFDAGLRALATHGITDGVPLALQVGAGGDPYHMWPVFASCGGSFFGVQKDGEHFRPVDEWRPSFIRAFSRIAELGQGPMGRGLLRPDLERDDAPALFLAGKAPFLIASSRVLWHLKQDAGARGEDPFEVVDVAAVPPLGEHPATPMVTVYGAFICRNGANRRVAEDFATTFLSRTTTGERLNRVTPRPPVQLQAMANVKEGDPWVRPYIEQCENGILMPTFPEMDRVWEVLGEAQARVLSPDADNPTQIAAEAADRGWDLIRHHQATTTA